VGPRRDTELALEELEAAAQTLAEVGLMLEERIVHQDQDPVFTRYRWLRAVLMEKRPRVSCSANGARGNTAVESFSGRLKVESGSLFQEARNVWELRRIVNERIVYYNAERRHSTLGNRAPMVHIRNEEIMPWPMVALAQPSTQSGAENRPHIPTPLGSCVKTGFKCPFDEPRRCHWNTDRCRCDSISATISETRNTQCNSGPPQPQASGAARCLERTSHR
jgi:hypothetical protein